MNEMFDTELLRWWEEAGGDFEDDDPRRVSLAVMDEAKLLPFLRSVAARTGRRMTLPDETYQATPEATWLAMEIAPHAKPAFIKRCSAAIDAFAARARAEEREQCAKVCFAVEEELLAEAERYHEARRYEEYERLESEATTVSIVKDRIRALSDEPSAEPTR